MYIITKHLNKLLGIFKQWSHSIFQHIITLEKRESLFKQAKTTAMIFLK